MCAPPADIARVVDGLLTTLGFLPVLGITRLLLLGAVPHITGTTTTQHKVRLV
jgi:hypothetical protein